MGWGVQLIEIVVSKKFPPAFNFKIIIFFKFIVGGLIVGVGGGGRTKNV